MRVALDAQLAVGTATGIGEYVRGLDAALRGIGVETIPLEWKACDPWRFDRRVIWDQAALPVCAALSRADLLHCTSGTMPLLSPLPTVVTVHDVAWLRTQRHARAYARAYFGPFSAARYRSARRAIVDSRFSRDELTELTEVDSARVEVVYPGVAEAFARIRRRPDAEPWLLAVGTVERRKNLEVVIRALRALDGLRLVSVGPFTSYREECERIARECGVAERVSFRGYVSREELLELYARAAAAVVPSLYEGFGYGAAQALCAGAPCAAANVSSLPEVLGEGGVLLDPHDPDAWSAALARMLADRDATERAESYRAEAAARFSWRAAAEATRAVYAAALV